METLRLFCDVARQRSFSQAAARHGITQSAASQRISQLERHLGVMLIDRSVRPLELTAGGDMFLRGVEQLLAKYDQLERQVSNLSQALQGEVKVDAIYSAGIDLLNQVKEEFEQQHPQARVVIEYKQPDQVHQAVRDRLCDLGIVAYPQQWRDVGALLLRNERMAVVCGPGHVLARRRMVKASELGRYDLAMFEASLPVGRHIRQYLKQHGVPGPRIASVFDNIDTIKGAVEVTDQVAILPVRTVQREVLAGTLALIELQPVLIRPLGIIHRRGRGTVFEPVTQAFVDFLMQHDRAKESETAEVTSK